MRYDIPTHLTISLSTDASSCDESSLVPSTSIWSPSAQGRLSAGQVG